MNGLLRAGGVSLILGALIFGSRSWSQPKKDPTPRTRIALINLSSVIKKYQKYQNFQAEIKEDITNFQKKDTDLREKIKTCQAMIDSPISTVAQKADNEKMLTKYKRELEDNNAEAKATLGRKSDDQMVLLYKEVHKVVERYAKAHEIELVMHFNDADEKSETEPHWSPANVARKMQAGACMPLYAAPGIDISEDIVTALNDGMHTDKKQLDDRLAMFSAITGFSPEAPMRFTIPLNVALTGWFSSQAAPIASGEIKEDASVFLLASPFISHKLSAKRAAIMSA